MENNIPLYRLRELIEKKYTKEKFETGCYLVARWVNGQSGRNTPVTRLTSYEVYLLTELAVTQYNDSWLTKPDAIALKQLFGLQSLRELFTLPETCQFDNPNIQNP